MRPVTVLLRTPPHLASLAFRVEGGLDISRIEELDSLVAPALRRDGVQVFVDIEAVTFMDSSGLGWLLRTQNELTLRNGSLRVVGGSGGVLSRLLALTGLEDQIDIYPVVPNDAEQSRAAQA